MSCFSKHRLAAFFQPPDLRDELARALALVDAPADRWTTLKNFARRRGSGGGAAGVVDPVMAIVLAHTFPRWDANVTKGTNHLLKSPFCVHPATGRVSVPIDVNRLGEFLPEKAPVLHQLLAEIDAWDSEMHGDDVITTDAQKTALWPSIKLLQGFVAASSKRR